MNVVTMLLQATLLLLVLIVLRPLLKRLLSARVRCTMWLIPALRLLIPFQLRSIFSIMAPVQAVSRKFENVVRQPVEPFSWLGSGIGLQNNTDTVVVLKETADAAGASSISIGSILMAIWIIGVVITGGMIIWQNIRFQSMLKRFSKPIGKKRGLMVYLMKGLPSPCLAGVIRPGIFLNEHTFISEQVRKMTIRHEYTHYKRLDHIWNAVRGLLLALYWFHPLVWFCSELFRSDCETACDETATRGMNASEREDYGMALITLASRRNQGSTGKFICLSTMSGSKKLLKERITELAKKRRFRCAALVAMMMAVILVFTMCTVPGQGLKQQSVVSATSGYDQPDETESETEYTEPDYVPAAGEVGTGTDLAYFLELSVMNDHFTDMDETKSAEILSEYGELLAGYQLMARVSENGMCAYIVGEYIGDNEKSPLWPLYSVDFNEEAQVLYTEAEEEAMSQATTLDELPDSMYKLTKSRIRYSQNHNLILIQPIENETWLDSGFSRYTFYPNGRAYIMDAVERGIVINDIKTPYLCVYLISETYGEIAEKIPLTETEVEAILAEERIELETGFGFGAGLYYGEESIYYTEKTGIPCSVLDLAVEKCGYRFENPSNIQGPILEAKLECSWLTEPVYADEAELARLEEILKNAEFGYVGGCGYGAKLTVEFAGGEKMTMFKGTDGCDTMVFGSYGGYFLGDEENTEFWEIFGVVPYAFE